MNYLKEINVNVHPKGDRMCGNRKECTTANALLVLQLNTVNVIINS